MHKRKGKPIFKWHNNIKGKGSLSINKLNCKSDVQKMMTALEDTILTLLNE